jgi:membrane protein YdbS with pleckstrin-like domain
VAGLRESARGRRYRSVPAAEQVQIDERRHGIVLAAPAIRTGVGLAIAVSGPGTLPLLLFAAASAVGRRGRLRRRLLVVTALVVALAGLSAVEGVGGAALLVLALVGWLAFDVADWYTDRLVVTNRRLYRLHGVVVTHRPSVALTSLTFVDLAEGPVGRVLRFGTLLFDSPAQRDTPLARFDFLPYAADVHERVLELRAAAMPKFPGAAGLM